MILRIVREEDRGQADSVAPEFLPYGSDFFERDLEVPSRRFQTTDFSAHSVGKRGVSAAKTYDDCFRVFSKSAEEAGFEGFEQSYLAELPQGQAQNRYTH